MKYINPIIILIAIAIAMGIVVGFHFAEILPPLLPLVCLLFLLLAVLWLSQRKKLQNTIWFGMFLFLFFTSLGCYNYQRILPSSQKNHYSHAQDTTNQFVIFRITEVLKPSSYYQKYIANIVAIDGSFKNGKILVNISKDSISKPLAIDTKILVKTTFNEVQKPKNPYQFNYAEYLKKQAIYHQVYFSRSEILKSNQGDRSLKGLAEDFRNQCISKLEETSIQKKELAIIEALVLGQKRNIDTKQYETYVAAGAIHILAVSGLHVGIFYAILLFLFSWLKKFKKSALIQSLCIVCCLWGYAVLTGLSPSVSRAVTMFSFFAIAQSLHRKTSTINTLSLSFISLLLYNPMYLFHVGFQLSYLAVLSILIIQPKLASYYKAKTKLGSLLWNTSTVTIAAQIGLAPLSLYYFHQFPGLFFLTNIVVLPLLGSTLGIGILVIVLSYFSILPDLLAQYYGYSIKLLNEFISWIAKQDAFLFTEISFSSNLLLTSYVCIIATLLFWYKWSFKHLVFWFISFVLILLVVHTEQWNRKPSRLVIFQQHKQSLIAIQELDQLTVLNTDTISTSNQNVLSNYKTGARCTNISEEKLQHLFRYKNTSVLVLDNIGIYPKMIKKPIVVLTQSTKVHLARFIDSIQPQRIIADGSNYKSYVLRWKETCEQKNIPFHSTYEKGAYIWE